MNQLSVFGNTVLTMSVAALCDNKRDIEVLEIDVSKFAYIYLDSMNRQQTEYRSNEHAYKQALVTAQALGGW